MHAPSPSTPGAPCRTILLVVEEPAISELLAASFRLARFIPVLAASAVTGRRLAGEVRPDVLLIDLDAPATADASLLSLHPESGERASPLGVMLSARSQALSDARGIAGSACLGIAKPFSPRELVNRIVRELASRGTRAPGRVLRKLRVGPLEMESDQHRVQLHLDGATTALELAPTEFKLLGCLMAHTDQLLSREQLRTLVWGESGEIDPRTVDQNIRRLRRCFKDAGAEGLIKTVRGLGYRLDIASR